MHSEVSSWDSSTVVDLRNMEMYHVVSGHLLYDGSITLSKTDRFSCHIPLSVILGRHPIFFCALASKVFNLCIMLATGIMGIIISHVIQYKKSH